MITLNTKTLNSFNSMVAPEITFGANLFEMCSIGEWKELELAYAYDVVIGSAADDIIGKDIYFTPALFNRGGETNPKVTSTLNGYWANLVPADIGNDVEMILVGSPSQANATNLNYKCYINTSDGFDFTIKLQFYLTHDVLSFNSNNGSYNNKFRFVKNSVSNLSVLDNSGINTCVYNGKAILDTYLKVIDSFNNTSESNRERLDFYAKFYNENPYYNTPIFTLKNSTGTAITEILNEDCKLEFVVNKPGGNANPHLVGSLIRTDLDNTTTDFITNNDLSMVKCDTAQTDHHIKLPTLDMAFVAGTTFKGSYTIDGASLVYGAKYRFLAICYAEDMSEKNTASFISDEFKVNCKPTIIKNAQDEQIKDWNTKESLDFDRHYNSNPATITYINERIAFHGLSEFDPDENIGHPFASIAGFEKYCTRFEMRIYKNDGVYKYTYASVYFIGMDWTNGTFDFVSGDSDYSNLSLGFPSVPVYKKEFCKSTNISYGYFFDWWIRSRCEHGYAKNKYLPSDVMSLSGTIEDNYWGAKSFGIDYIYTFNYPGLDTEIVVNSFENVLSVLDFDNDAIPPQQSIISSIKDNTGKDLNVRKYICDSDSDLISDNTGLWLPVKCYLSDNVYNGILSIMLSVHPTNQYNLQEINKEPVTLATQNSLLPLDMQPQILEPTLIRNMTNWTAGLATFEININNLVPGIDYKLYAIRTISVEA